ncbi:hypothetical protein H4R20_002854 [Coemansia guatemalensis]|uniref:Uncharacterized protein n=1 Tax=Coemansia guatemalensis TaxID=2761395 RepID=A0A9W8LTL0_9FUNG|nr:hypothetical protein H4R20_002854 [Coemansia guatemalensis]
MPEDSSGNADHSAVFRSIWKGSDRTAGAQGQLRMETLTHMLGHLTWRELGLLLVRLSQPLEAEPLSPDTKHRLPWIRSLVALAGTIAYMQMAKKFASDSPVTPVNSAFVTTVFADMTAATLYVQQKATGAYSEIVYHVFKAIAVVLAAHETDEPPRFAADAVLSGLLGGTSEGPPKRRRTASNDSSGLKSLPREPNGFLQLLGDTLHDTAHSSAYKHIVRILRAQNGAVVAKTAARPDSELAQPSVLRLVHALADRALDLMDPNSQADEAYLGNVFACIRDTVPLAKAPSADKSTSATPQPIESAAKVSQQLGELFSPYIHGLKATSLYSFCAAKRHRCYQWSALCHVSTWIAGWCPHSNIVAEAVAECGRLCWLQSVDVVPEDISANQQIWFLLLCESLGNIALVYPSLQNSARALHTPLFMRSIDTQKHMFSGLALLIPRIIERLPTTSSVQKTTSSLVLRCLHLCEKTLRLIRPQGSSIGLPISGKRAPVFAEDGDIFKMFRCTPEGYVFRPECAALLVNPSIEDPHEILKRQEREESQECDREIMLGKMFMAFSILSDKIADDSNTDASGMRNILAMAFRTTLRWINAFAVSARDNAGKQLRLLETQRRINIGIVGDKARLLAFATDWTRLQKIPVVRQPRNVSAVDTGQSAAKSTDIDLGPFKSVVYTMFFLACRLWQEFPMLDRSDLGDKDTLRIYRDVWGISNGSLRFLKHATRYRVVRRAFMELDLAPRLCEVIAPLLSGSGTPELILSIKDDAMLSRTKPPLPEDEVMQHDSLSFPLLELGENIDSASDDGCEKDDDCLGTGIELHSSSEDSADGGMIERLLLESAQQRKPISKQRPLDEYYSTSLLAPMWSEYTDQLLALPASIAFGSEPGNVGQAAFFDMLADSDGVIFQMFSPLIAAKQHLAADNALWLAVYKAAPLNFTMNAVKSATPEAIPDIYIAAALILPELAAVRQSADVENGVAAIVRGLVNGLFGDRKDRCASALLFLTWRQRQSICSQSKKCLRHLRSTASGMLGSMKLDATLLEAQGICAVDKRTFHTDRAQLDEDLVTLSGTEMKSDDRPIATSMALLAKHSSVFSILFTGRFSEAQAVLSGKRHFDLDSYHSTLVELVALLHKCVISAHYEEIVFSPNSLDEDVGILRLAIFYDLRPVIVLLACHISERVCSDCISFANDDGVQALAETYCENWELYFSSVYAVRAVQRSIAAVALLALDRIDLASAIEDDSSSFATTATYLFQGLQDV